MTAERPQLPFYRPELSRESASESRSLELGVHDLIDILRSDTLHDLINEDKVTLAMVKPNVGPEANKFGLGDVEASDEIESRISGLGVIAKFSFQFDSEGADVFYEGPAKTESMMPAPPLKDTSFENRWEEYKHLMMSGPVTVLLLFGDDAVEKWRAHLGHWNIVKNHNPDTIRGALGVDNHNNLVHGSDSRESVKREVEIVTSQLLRLTAEG